MTTEGTHGMGCCSFAVQAASGGLVTCQTASPGVHIADGNPRSSSAQSAQCECALCCAGRRPRAPRCTSGWSAWGGQLLPMASSAQPGIAGRLQGSGASSCPCARCRGTSLPCEATAASSQTPRWAVDVWPGSSQCWHSCTESGFHCPAGLMQATSQNPWWVADLWPCSRPADGPALCRR